MQKRFRNLNSSNISKKTVVIRADLDIPVFDGNILDNSKLKSILPTVKFLLEKNCKIIILGCHGDSNGEFDDTLSLMDIRFELGRLIEKPVKFANIESCENSIKFMDFGEILMIENIAFSKEEYDKKKEDKKGFLEKLIAQTDSFILETLETASESTSVRLLTKFVKDRYIGMGIEAFLNETQRFEDKKFTVIYGGALNKLNVSILENILLHTGTLLVNNEVALAILKESGIKIGNHNFEDKLQKKIKTILGKVKKLKINLETPEDFVVMDSKDRVEKIPTQSIKNGYLVKDIGEKTIEKYKNIIETSENILWIGACGDTLQESTSQGTKAIGESITLSAPKSSFKMIVGEDILIAASKLNLKTKRVNLILPSTRNFLHFLDGSVFDILKKFTDKN